MCVPQDGGRTRRPHSHPPPEPAFQRKGHLRPPRRAQHGHHGPARLAPGPRCVEQGGRLTDCLASPASHACSVHTPCPPSVPVLLCVHRNPTHVKTAPQFSPFSLCGSCLPCLRETAANAAIVSFLSNLKMRHTCGTRGGTLSQAGLSTERYSHSRQPVWDGRGSEPPFQKTLPGAGWADLGASGPGQRSPGTPP